MQNLSAKTDCVLLHDDIEIYTAQYPKNKGNSEYKT